MNCLMLPLLIVFPFFINAQYTLDTLEGWWTMSDTTHYFELEDKTKMIFNVEELFEMEQLYLDIVPEKEIPIQVQIIAILRQNYIEVKQLQIVPEGCED